MLHFVFGRKEKMLNRLSSPRLRIPQAPLRGLESVPFQGAQSYTSLVPFMSVFARRLLCFSISSLFPWLIVSIDVFVLSRNEITHDTAVFTTVNGTIIAYAIERERSISIESIDTFLSRTRMVAMCHRKSFPHSMAHSYMLHLIFSYHVTHVDSVLSVTHIVGNNGSLIYSHACDMYKYTQLRSAYHFC